MNFFKIIAGANRMFDFKEKYGISREEYRKIFCDIKIHNLDILSKIEKDYDIYAQNDECNYHKLINVIDNTEYKIHNKKQIKQLKKEINNWPHYLILDTINLTGGQKSIIKIQFRYFFSILFLIMIASFLMGYLI